MRVDVIAADIYNSFTYENISKWTSMASEKWNLVRSQFLVGDFRGDGKADLAAFYDYGNNETGLLLFPSDANFQPQLVWRSGARNWVWSRSHFLVGDFQDDGKADLAAFYSYSDDVTGLWIFPSDANFKPKPVWLSVLPPAINSFSPTAGEKGDEATIRGDNFVGVERVLLGSASTQFNTVDPTTIKITVPNEASLDPKPFTVINPAGSAVSNNLFTVQQTFPPVINGFAPTRGRIGTGVTINGRNFRKVTTVQFNGVNANFKINSDDSITTSVPANAQTGAIKVGNSSGSVLSSNNFEVEVSTLPANLGFVSTWIDPTEFPTPGLPFTVYFSFLNGGGTATGRFTIRIQRDNFAEYTDIEAPSYAPGTGGFVYWPFPNGLPAGDHFFYAYLDYFNQVAEVSELDNISYHGFNVRTP